MANQPATTTSEFKNLQVLPKDIPREQLLATMQGFTRALGVKCNHCHVVTATEPRTEFDFPADTEHKRAARVMLRLVKEINGTWIPRVKEAAGEREAGGEPEQAVGCWTCHRGHEEPESPPPPPRT